MKNQHRKIRIRPYVWDQGKPTEVKGFMLDVRHSQIFVPEADAVDLSNRIIDFIENK